MGQLPAIPGTVACDKLVNLFFAAIKNFAFNLLPHCVRDVSGVDVAPRVSGSAPINLNLGAANQRVVFSAHGFFVTWFRFGLLASSVAGHRQTDAPCGFCTCYSLNPSSAFPYPPSA